MDEFIVQLAVNVEARDTDEAEELIRDLIEGDPLVIDYTINDIKKEVKVG